MALPSQLIYMGTFHVPLHDKASEANDANAS